MGGTVGESSEAEFGNTGGCHLATVLFIYFIGYRRPVLSGAPVRFAHVSSKSRLTITFILL